MPYYNYEATGKGGKPVRGQASAMNRQEMIASLQREGFIILSIKESAPISEKFHRKLHKKARQRDLILFAKEMAILLENGVVITEALEVILKQMDSVDLINALKDVKKNIENGTTFHGAIDKHPGIFGDFWRDMIDAGEVSGQLPFVIRQLESFLESSDRLRKKMVNALIYPALLFTVATFVVCVFMFKIVPVFQDLFTTFGGRLPAFTEMVLGISMMFRKYFLLMLVAVAIMIFMFKKAVSTKNGRRLYENFLMKLPVMGSLFLSLAIEKFSSTLGVLLKSGIPIIRAMEVASRISGSLMFTERIDEARAKVTAGLPFSDALGQTGLFPPLAVQLVLVAEKTGNFSGMLEEISRYYSDVVDLAVTRFTAVIEPIVLMFMAVVIGGLLIAMFLPIFKLASGGG